MIRLLLIWSLRPVVSRGRVWLSNLQKSDKHRSTSPSLLLPKYRCVNRRTTRYLSCIGASDGEMEMNLDVAKGSQPRDQADVWTRCQSFISKGDVDHFVLALLDYLRSSGGHGRGNLANELSRCVKHVRHSCCTAMSSMCLHPPEELLIEYLYSPLQENQSRTLCFLCHCVEHIIMQTADDPDANTLAHALLDSIPAVMGVQIAVKQQALSTGAALFWQLLNPVHCRLAMKLAQASLLLGQSIMHEDVNEWAQRATCTMSCYIMQHELLAQAPNIRGCTCMQGFCFTEESLWEASQASADTMQGMPSCSSFQRFEQEICKRLLVLLDSSKSSKPAISLLKQFKQIAVKYFYNEEVLRRLVDAKQIDLAIAWATQSGHDLQVKMASHASENFLLIIPKLTQASTVPCLYTAISGA